MMLDREAPIFRNIPQALHVSFIIEAMPASVKSSTSKVIELLKEQAGIIVDTNRDGRINYYGLDPLDIRAQSAMTIKDTERVCITYEWAALRAWFSPAIPPSKDESSPNYEYSREPSNVRAYKLKHSAILALLGYVQPRLSIQSPDAQQLMLWHVHTQGELHKKLTERAIAAEHDLSQSTVHRDIVKISATCKALRQNGMRRLASMFERDGLVDAAEECAA